MTEIYTYPNFNQDAARFLFAPIRLFIHLCAMKIFLSIFLIYPFFAVGQTDTNDSLAKKLVERHKMVAASKMSMPGYRIQIYFGNDRNKAQEIRSAFIQLYPETPAYLIYQQPNFKVRTGDFRSRIEAAGFLHKINPHFTNAFIVPDEVKLPDL